MRRAIMLAGMFQAASSTLPFFMVTSPAQAFVLFPPSSSHCACIPSASKSEQDEKSVSRGKKGPTRSEQRDIDSIVSGMGLTPVKRRVGNERSNGITTQSNFLNISTTVFLSDSSAMIPMETQLEYSRNGHTVLRNFLDSSPLQTVHTTLTDHASQQALQAWRQKVDVASNNPTLAESCTTIQDCREQLDRLGLESLELPFLQYFNTWRYIPLVHKLALDLGRAASVLMDVPTVRLYQDAVFWKRAGDGPTPWHTDARMAPFDTAHMITFWIPLQPIPKHHGTALLFASKSHSDFALPFWNDFDGPEYRRLEERYKFQTVDYMPLQLGDVTVHSGWTLHCADANPSSTQDRLALAISYVDACAQVRENCLQKQSSSSSGGYGDNEDQWSYKEWVEQVPARQEFQHVRVPIVWPPPSGGIDC